MKQNPHAVHTIPLPRGGMVTVKVHHVVAVQHQPTSDDTPTPGSVIPVDSKTDMDAITVFPRMWYGSILMTPATKGATGSTTYYVGEHEADSPTYQAMSDLHTRLHDLANPLLYSVHANDE